MLDFISVLTHWCKKLYSSMKHDIKHIESNHFVVRLFIFLLQTYLKIVHDHRLLLSTEDSNNWVTWTGIASIWSHEQVLDSQLLSIDQLVRTGYHVCMLKQGRILKQWVSPVLAVSILWGTYYTTVPSHFTSFDFKWIIILAPNVSHGQHLFNFKSLHKLCILAT